MAIFPREAINSGSSGQGFWCNVAAKDVVMALTELGIWQIVVCGLTVFAKTLHSSHGVGTQSKGVGSLVWEIGLQNIFPRFLSNELLGFPSVFLTTGWHQDWDWIISTKSRQSWFMPWTLKSSTFLAAVASWLWPSHGAVLLLLLPPGFAFGVRLSLLQIRCLFRDPDIYTNSKEGGWGY